MKKAIGLNSRRLFALDSEFRLYMASVLTFLDLQKVKELNSRIRCFVYGTGFILIWREEKRIDVVNFRDCMESK